MSADRPINADVPSPEGPEEAAAGAPEPPEAEPGSKPKPATPTQLSPDSGDKGTSVGKEADPASKAAMPGKPADSPQPPEPPKPPRPPRRRRQPIPGALKLIAGLVIIAIAFIVLVVVAGSGGPNQRSTSTGAAPAPAPAPVEEAPAGEPEGEEPPSSEAQTELGYPSFATDNTTRVGGSTPAENAAASALAVFPSTTPSQRPAAVTLVEEGDWPVAIAAAALMAPPLRAPMLYSNADEVPAATEEAFAALDPQGSKATKGASGFGFGEVALPPDPGSFEQIRPAAASQDAGEGDASDEGDAATAAVIAELRDRLFGSAPDAVLVAPLGEPGFAAPAAAWAARSGDPVLFADQGSLPAATAEALKRHTGVPAYVLGPPSAISDSVLGEIKKLGPRVKRVAGKDPVANAIAFARFADPAGSFGWNVNDPGHGFVLARADAPLDAAAAAPLSASGTWGPLLLTDSADTLPSELREYFLDVKPGYTTNPTRAFYNHVWVIGDQEAIDVKQQAEVNELAELAKIGGEE